MPTELGRDIAPLLTGDSLWGDTVTRGLVERRSDGRVVKVFEDAPQSLYASLEATACRTPGAIALVDDASDRWTFAELRILVDQFAERLTTEGIRPGDRVGLLMETSLEFCVALYAANREGAVVVPIPTKYKDAEVRSLLERSDVAVVVAEMGLAHLVPDGIRAVEPAVIAHAVAPARGLYPRQRIPDPNRDAILMYTSGTTSACKGVLLTNRNVGHAIVAYQRILNITADDSTIIPVPIYHITGMVALLGLFVHCGGTVFLHRRFDAVRVLETVRDQGVSFLHASPTVFARLLEHESEFSALPTLRAMACGAAHMPVSRLESLHRWLPGMEFRTVYGLTETASPGLIFPGDAAVSPHRGSSGRPIPGMDVALLDDKGEPVAAGQTGEIWLRGTNLLRRYDQTLSSLRPDGWLNTGDVGHANADGYVYITDRTKDMINRGGEKIWCIDLEEALRQLPGVADAAVVGIPNAIYGEVPVALIVATAGSRVDLDVVRKGLRPVVAGYMVPAAVRLAAALPVTANLKVDKRAVRKLFAETVVKGGGMSAEVRGSSSLMTPFGSASATFASREEFYSAYPFAALGWEDWPRHSGKAPLGLDVASPGDWLLTLCTPPAYADLDSAQGVLVAFDRSSGLVFVLKANATFPEAEARVS